MKITVNASTSYNIHLGHNLLSHLKDYVSDSKILLVSDEIVNSLYGDIVVKQFDNIQSFVVPCGETAKSFKWYEKIISFMLENNYGRNDTIIALGGGVVGDLAGFVSATYKRGIKFVNIPTTTLSQIDSSIGGKVGINVDGIKNCVGAFYQPSVVIIDFDVLKTLSIRQYNSGLVEAIKAGLIYDEKLFALFEEDNIDIEQVIYLSLLVKKDVVEKDELELGLRKILNFGHTIGHAYESYFDLGKYYHGECVAFGMMDILDNKMIKNRLENILRKLNIECPKVDNKEDLYKYIVNDKKVNNDMLDIVKVDDIGKAYIKKIKIEDILNILDGGSL